MLCPRNLIFVLLLSFKQLYLPTEQISQNRLFDYINCLLYKIITTTFLFCKLSFGCHSFSYQYKRPGD